ncbi:MAG: VCBS repeat-containing protein [Saprospiraceae bacterium]|nr:VCBS repeat-containing protein [Saprospiraceae bacterium]
MAKDVNGDGKVDLINFYEHVSGKSRVWAHLNTDNGFQVDKKDISMINFNVKNNPYEIIVSDFNADGKSDFVLVSEGDGTLNIMHIFGGENGFKDSPTSSYKISGAGFSEAQIWKGNDTNGDGLSELICINPNGFGDALAWEFS